jgi:hypothetical protein
MKKPVIRWTVGGSNSNGYKILSNSIRNIINLYSDRFEYFVCYNDVDINKIKELEKKFNNVIFIEQSWRDCPIKIKKPKSTNKHKQKINGSFWKICPPRMSPNTHEIILDNDLIFLKKPKILEKFLSSNRNFIIKDSKIYLGSFHDPIYKKNKKGYNSGVIGLAPGYDFSSEIQNNYKLFYKNKLKSFELGQYDYGLDYGEEQGLLMYTLLQTDPLIGNSEDFAGIHSNKIYLNCLPNKEIFKLWKKKDKHNSKFIEMEASILNEIFNRASVVHFLESNRNENHLGWKHYRRNKIH